jgi:hypothetical protein
LMDLCVFLLLSYLMNVSSTYQSFLGRVFLLFRCVFVVFDEYLYAILLEMRSPWLPQIFVLYILFWNLK